MQAFFNNTKTGLYSLDMPGGRSATKPQPKFGQRLAAIRIQEGLSQTQLGKRLGVSREIVAYYERCAQNPTIEFVEKAAEAFGVPIGEMLNHPVKATRKPGPPQKFQRLIEQVSVLPRNKQKFVMELLESYLSNGHKQAA